MFDKMLIRILTTVNKQHFLSTNIIYFYNINLGLVYKF